MIIPKVKVIINIHIEGNQMNFDNYQTWKYEKCQAHNIITFVSAEIQKVMVLIK